MKIYKDYINNSLNREKLSLKPLRLTIFIAVLALTVFTFIFSSIVKNDQDASKRIFGDYHVHLITDLDSEEISTLNKNVNIEKLGFLVDKGLEQIHNSNLKIKLASIDENYSNIVKRKLIKGQMPKADGEILIPLLTAKDLGLKLGDYLETSKDSGEITSYKIVGLIDSGYRSWEEETVGFLNKDQNLPIEKANEVTIWYKNIRDTYKYTPEIVEYLGFDYDTSLTSSLNDSPSTGLKISYNLIYLSSRFVNSKHIYTSATSQSYPKIFVAGSLLISIFFIFVIKNIFKVWENGQIREYGLLLSVGAKKKDLRKIIFKRLFKIAKVPVFLGLVFGIGFSFLVLKIMTKYYFLASQDMVRNLEEGFTLNLNPFLILIILLLSLLVIGISALGPIRKISKINIIDSMKLYRTEKVKNKEKLLRSSSFLSDFSKINLRQNRGKILFSAFSISIASLFLCLMLALLGGLNLELKYNTLDKFENYEYRVSYINPKPFPEDLIGQLTNDFKYEFMNFRSNSFYLSDENSYSDLLDKTYLENYYGSFKEILGQGEISLNIIGVNNNKYVEITKKLNIPSEDLNKENSGILVNSIAKDISKAVKLRDHTKVLNESTKTLIVTDYSKKFADIYEDLENKEIKLNVIKYTDNEDLLKVPQRDNVISFITSMDNYFKILEESNQDHTAMVTEDIYFNNENLNLDEVKDLLFENISDRDLELRSRKNQNDFEYYSNRILYSLLFSISIIATGLGISQAYAATSSLREARKQEYTLLMITGMDKSSLRKLAIKEVNQSIKYILVFSIVSLGISVFLGHNAYDVFSPIQILLNMKVYIWILYLILIYIILRKYYLKTLDDVSLTNNSRII